MELSGPRVGLDSRRASLACQIFLTRVPLSFGNKDEGQEGPEFDVVLGIH
jgi:hypothetical protein